MLQDIFVLHNSMERSGVRWGSDCVRRHVCVCAQSMCSQALECRHQGSRFGPVVELHTLNFQIPFVAEASS